MPANQRKLIGEDLSRGRLQAWIVPYNDRGSPYRRKVMPLPLDWNFYSPTPGRAKGELLVTNHTPVPLTLPAYTRWEDAYGRQYAVTNAVSLVPRTRSYAVVQAVEPGYVSLYHGQATLASWPGEPSDEESELLSPEVIAYADDAKDAAFINVLSGMLTAKGGTNPGNAVMAKATQSAHLDWSFEIGEWLAGFYVFTERLSGYLIHRVRTVPMLRFEHTQFLRVKAGSIKLVFLGVKPEEW